MLPPLLDIHADRVAEIGACGVGADEVSEQDIARGLAPSITTPAVLLKPKTLAAAGSGSTDRVIRRAGASTPTDVAQVGAGGIGAEEISELQTSPVAWPRR